MTRQTLLSWGGALAASALLLTGCSAGSTPPAGGSPNGGAQSAGTGVAAPGKDPCTLLTRAEAEQALGEPATGEGKGAGEGLCTWTGVANDGSDLLTVHVADPAILKRVVSGSNGTPGGVPIEAVSGVGDEAIYADVLKFLFVRKGSTGFTIQLVTIAALQTSERDKEVTLAQAILGRL